MTENFTFTSSYTLKTLKEETNKIDGAAIQKRYDDILKIIKEREDRVYREVEADGSCIR